MLKSRRDQMEKTIGSILHVPHCDVITRRAAHCALLLLLSGSIIGMGARGVGAWATLLEGTTFALTLNFENSFVIPRCCVIRAPLFPDG